MRSRDSRVPVTPPVRSPPAGRRRSGHQHHRPERGHRPAARPAAARPAYQPAGRHHGGGDDRRQPGPRRRPGRPEDQRDGRREQQAARRPPGSRPAPSRCGRPRTPVRASSSRSGSTLAKCAPAPSSAAGGDQPGRRGGRAGQGEHHEGRQRAERDARTAAPRPRWTSAASRRAAPRPGRRWRSSAAAGFSGQRQQRAWPRRPAAAARPTVRRLDRPGGDRLVRTPDRGVPVGVQPVVDSSRRRAGWPAR